jgi:hypothetical protein
MLCRARATHIAIEGELRYGEHRPSNIRNAQVHLSVVVLEDAQAGDLLGEVIHVDFRIARRNAKQHQQARSDLANHPLLDRDGSSRNPLYYGTHFCSGQQSGRVQAVASRSHDYSHTEAASEPADRAPGAAKRHPQELSCSPSDLTLLALCPIVN